LGVQVYALANSGHWDLLGAFGKNAHDGEGLSRFDPNLLTRTAETREIAISTRRVDGIELDVWACVAIRSDLAVGAIVRTPTKKAFMSRPVNGALKAIQDSAGLFLDAVRLKTKEINSEERSLASKQLPHRQLAILLGMAWVKTNLIISQEMLLSESSIKQEPVKI
jgi:hypothetical protein